MIEMNVTKFLCKHFDEGNKGYVTLWDIISNGFWYLVALFGLMTVLYTPYKLHVTYGLLYILNLNNPNPEWVFWWDPAYVVILIIEILILINVLFYGMVTIIEWVYNKLKSIRVVECKLQK